MTARTSAVRRFLTAWLLLSALSVLWALATPISAAPDEPAHFVKAASVARGQLVGEPSAAGSVVQVPRYVAFTSARSCYAFQSELPADCAPVAPEGPDDLVDAATTAGLYNPVYYAVVGWPSLLFSGDVGLYAMRIVSALFSSAFLAIAFLQLRSISRGLIPTLAFAVAVTPMVLFLDSSVNPNSIETTAVLATFTTMLAVVLRPDAAALPMRAGVLAASAFFAVNSRGLSPLWVVIALAAPLLLADRAILRDLVHSRAVRIAAACVLAAAVIAVAWTLGTNSLGGVFIDGGAPVAPDVGTSPVTGFLYVLFGTFGYAQGLIGVFGWLDTPSPQVVYFVWAAFVGGLALIGGVVTRGRRRLLVILMLAALVLIPPILQGIYITRGGLIWQGRYILPLFVCLIVALGVLIAERLGGTLSDGDARALAIIVLSAWGLSHAYAFATALRRYAVGYSGDIGTMLIAPSWSPPLGVAPLLVVFTAVLAAGCVVLVRSTRSRGL
jgi:hypothetical protein